MEEHSGHSRHGIAADMYALDDERYRKQIDAVIRKLREQGRRSMKMDERERLAARRDTMFS